MATIKTIPVKNKTLKNPSSLAWLFTLALFLLPVFLNANTIIPFWKEDFSAGQFPSMWVTTDPASDPISWEYCSGDEICPLEELTGLDLFPNERFRSGSMENGYAFLFPNGHGSVTLNHSSALQTNVIDCTDKDQVFVAFNTFIMAQGSDPDTAAVLEVKSGNSDWEAFTIFQFLNRNLVDINPFFKAPAKVRIESYNGQHVCIDISSIAAGESDVSIRWRWNYKGDVNYCWLIDDVELLDENPLHENALWGMMPGEGDFDGGLHDWQTPSILADCNWVWSHNGMVDYPDSSDEANAFGCSTTLGNGVALMNAVCIAQETAFFSELISPIIDLSNNPNGKRIGVRFNQSGAIGNNNNNGLPVTSIMVSIDGGLTHIDTLFLNLNEPFKKPFCKNSLIPLPEEAIGAEELVIKFVFSGTSFYWMIDDVRIVELFDYDLKISEDYFAVAPNYSTPATLVRPIPFSAEVQNAGDETQESITLSVRVINDETQEEEFRDSVSLGALMPGERSADFIFDKKFTPQPNQSYTGYYFVKGEGAEENPSDNQVSFRFSTKGTVYSKNKDKYSINGGFTPLENIFQLEFEIGNCFFIPPGSNVTAPSMFFSINNPRQLFENDNEDDVDFLINLYRWKSGSNFADANGDFLANPDEFDEIAESVYTLAGGLLPWEVITVPFPDAIPLEDSTYYFVTVNYFSPVISNGAPARFFISASEEINYAAMFDQSVACDLPAFTSLLRVGFDQDFRINPWGLLRTPFIGLNIGGPVAVDDVFQKQVSINLYPNPAADQIVIDFSDENIKGDLAIEIYDICGLLVQRRQNVNGYVSQLPIDISQLADGMYNLHVISEKQILTKKFVVTNGF